MDNIGQLHAMFHYIKFMIFKHMQQYYFMTYFIYT